LDRNVYEAMFLFDSNRYSGDAASVTNRVHELIQRHGGEILASRPWDERRLAYPIKGHRKGVYYLAYFSMEGPKITALERDCKLFEPILRQLILKVDRQLVEQLLAQVASTAEAARYHRPDHDDEPAEGNGRRRRDHDEEDRG